MTGQYIADCHVTTPQRIALDDRAAAKLWEASEAITGVRFSPR